MLNDVASEVSFSLLVRVQTVDKTVFMGTVKNSSAVNDLLFFCMHMFPNGNFKIKSKLKIKCKTWRFVKSVF